MKNLRVSVLCLFLILTLAIPGFAVNGIDQNNTRVLPLASGAVFVGVPTDLLNWVEICITVYTDADSAADGLVIQFSSDGKTWYSNGDVYDIMAGHEKTFTVQVARRYYRVKYTNGGLPQTIFDFGAMLRTTRGKPSSHSIKDPIAQDDDAELVKSVNVAEDETGTFVNVRAVQGDTGYNLKVSLDQVEPTTNSVQVIDYAHGELHSGTHFMVRDYVNVSKNATHYFLMRTPDTTKWAHTTMGFEAISSKVYVTLTENPTVSAVGTQVNSYNRNRNFANGQTTYIYDTPTVTASGTLLARYVIGSGKNAGGGSRDNEEILLKQNTDYSISA